MGNLTGTFIARARTDKESHLLEAQEPLASLQKNCGGEIPGLIAIPELFDLVAKVQESQLRLARNITAFDGEKFITCWAEASPNKRDDGGCFVGIADWKEEVPEAEPRHLVEARKRDIDQASAELSARLDAAQNVLSVEGEARDLAEMVAMMRESRGSPWTEFVQFPQNSHKQPLHWRLLDGAICRVDGSDRIWTVSLIPLGQPEAGSAGFELYLIADKPLVSEVVEAVDGPQTMHSIGRDLSPVLRQPIARIIANAETIRSKMAGPLADEYSTYAADIAAAGQHLLGLIEDLADLEVVESDSFSTAPDEIDVGDVARRATGILAVRAQEKGIELIVPEAEVSAPAVAEFRRVLQIMLNLIGNAIRYSPKDSKVVITLQSNEAGTRLIVSDNGPGLSADQQGVIFEKFERLGRSGDGGSGLGLYISRRIARAMGGELSVHSEQGEGAHFYLDLPNSV